MRFQAFCLYTFFAGSSRPAWSFLALFLASAPNSFFPKFNWTVFRNFGTDMFDSMVSSIFDTYYKTSVRYGFPLCFRAKNVSWRDVAERCPTSPRRSCSSQSTRQNPPTSGHAGSSLSPCSGNQPTFITLKPLF